MSRPTTLEGLPIRCPSCARLMAVRLSTGEYEIRRGGNLIATIYDGEVACAFCGNGRAAVRMRRPDILTVEVPPR